MILELMKVDYSNGTMLIVDNSTGDNRVLRYDQVLQLLISNIPIKNIKLNKTGFSYNLNGVRDGVKFNFKDQNSKNRLKAALLNQQKRDTEKQNTNKNNNMIKCKGGLTPIPNNPNNKEVVKPKAVLASGNIKGNRPKEKVVYRGEVFLSTEHLCKKFNRDVNTYKNLISEGYSQDEALGLIPLRPKSSLNPSNKKSVEKFFDAMENARLNALH